MKEITEDVVKSSHENTTSNNKNDPFLGHCFEEQQCKPQPWRRVIESCKIRKGQGDGNKLADLGKWKEHLLSKDGLSEVSLSFECYQFLIISLVFIYFDEKWDFTWLQNNRTLIIIFSLAYFSFNSLTIFNSNFLLF